VRCTADSAAYRHARDSASGCLNRTHSAERIGADIDRLEATRSRRLAANKEKVSARGVERIRLQDGREVDLAYQVTGTPSAVLVDPSGQLSR
jgi:hypothetical protein